MRILVAPDKFKGSLGAAEVAECMAAGLRDVFPDAEISLMPVADGGEGTASVICAAMGGEWHSCEVRDPLGRSVQARYCTIAHGTTAVMEMSEASGLCRLAAEERDPTIASSLGTGEMLLDAAQRGAKKIIIGLGGSGTNDGGFGMARALGFRFLDAAGGELEGLAPALTRLDHLDAPKNLLLPEIIAAADVRNPLLGPRGATRTFGMQKGAAAEQVETLEAALARLADVVAATYQADFRDAPGAGAAGGLGFALLSFCGASMRAGFDVVAESIGLESAVQAADIIVTGEGRLDAQTAQGKAPAGVATLARKYGKKSYAIVGQLQHFPELHHLFDDVVVVATAPLSTAAATAEAGRLLREGGRELARRYKVALAS
jgi:glycerate kinase